MAPNGTTSRKSTQSLTHFKPANSSNIALTAPAASKPIKREESAQSDGMFDDLLDEYRREVKLEIRNKIPGTKKAGSWDVEGHGGMHTACAVKQQKDQP